MLDEYNPSAYKDGITAILTVYNEEKIIERCLKSLQGVVDEIVVLHDGECRDRTLDIARKYTDKVIVAEHKGVAELHNISILQYITYSWLLRIDADEFLSTEMIEQLPDLIQSKTIDAYAFVWQYWNGTRYITRGAPHKPALFRMSKVRAVEFISKNYTTAGMMQKLPIRIEHQPDYNNYTPSVFKNKWKKWIKNQAERTLDNENTRFYNYREEDIAAFYRYLNLQVRLAHPLTIPAWFALSFFSFIKRLEVWRNLSAIHVPFYMGEYAAWMCWYIWLGKRNTRKKQKQTA